MSNVQIWDEAGAFTISNIDDSFQTILPTQEQYEAYGMQANHLTGQKMVSLFSLIGRYPEI